MDLAALEQKARAELDAATDEAALHAWHTKYFGKQGEVVLAVNHLKDSAPAGADPRHARAVPRADPRHPAGHMLSLRGDHAAQRDPVRAGRGPGHRRAHHDG